MFEFREKELRGYFDYITKHSVQSKFRSFMYKSRSHALICLLLGSISKDELGYTFENICSLIPNKLMSRTTILTILQEGKELKYFSKSTYLSDKRKQFYKLSKSPKSRIVSWARDMNRIFNIK
tara:strand:+ start:236 stop:604 length:369 start_codon:yes stop_codon:yes gene_type:complete